MGKGEGTGIMSVGSGRDEEGLLWRQGGRLEIARKFPLEVGCIGRHNSRTGKRSYAQNPSHSEYISLAIF